MENTLNINETASYVIYKDKRIHLDDGTMCLLRDGLPPVRIKTVSPVASFEYAGGDCYRSYNDGDIYLTATRRVIIHQRIYNNYDGNGNGMVRILSYKSWIDAWNANLGAAVIEALETIPEALRSLPVEA